MMFAILSLLLFFSCVVVIAWLLILPEHEIGIKTTTEKVDFINGTDTYSENKVYLKQHNDMDFMAFLVALVFILAVSSIACACLNEWY